MESQHFFTYKKDPVLLWATKGTYFSSKMLYLKLSFDYLKKSLMGHLPIFSWIVSKEPVSSSLMSSTWISLSNNFTSSLGWPTILLPNLHRHCHHCRHISAIIYFANGNIFLSKSFTGACFHSASSE